MIPAVNHWQQMAASNDDAQVGTKSGGNAMTLLPIILSVWGLTILIMATLLLYRSRLTKDEEDQLFLDDSFSQEKAAQAAIAARAEKIAPLVKGSEILAAVATLCVIGYFVIDMFNQFK
jgi:hypothetical protein